jgi:hypothetical protein
MSCRDVGLEPGDVAEAMETVGLRYPLFPTQSLEWHRAETSVFDAVEIVEGKIVHKAVPDWPVIVHGHRPGRNGSRIEDIRLGVIDGKMGRLVVSTAGGFAPARFARWVTPPPFDGEPPFFAEAKAEGWL